MLREALEEFSAILRQMVGLVVTAGTFIMVVAFVGNRLGLRGVEFWIAMTVVGPASLLVAVGVVLHRLSRRRQPVDPGLYFVAGNGFLSTEAALTDETHRLDDLDQHIDLRNNAEDVVMTERYEGRNVRNEPSEGFRFYFDSETFLDDDVTIRQHTDDGDLEELELRKVHHDSDFVGIYEAEFVEPIEQNETFVLEVVSRMGSWDLSEGQLVYYDANRFERGIGSVRCSVEMDSPPSSITGYRAVNHSDTTHHRDPVRLDFSIDETDLGSNEADTEFWIEARNVYDSIFMIEMDWDGA